MDYKAFFDRPVSRAGTNSLKWDVPEGELPMWVADMDFLVAPPITEAIRRRTEHGIFGYSVIPEEWYEAVAGWWSRRHRWAVDPGWVIFATGVVPILSSVVRKLTTVGENVLVQPPVYNIFYNSIVNNGRNALECPLRRVGDRYEMDFERLEELLALPQTTMTILCNPHNPVGRIWTAEELERFGALCKKHHVLVVSDEIHCDLTAPGVEYVPFAGVSEACRENSVVCVAPSKTFNIAGLQSAAAIVPDPVLRHKVERGLNTDEVAEPNVFAIQATVAAFREGEPWLDALREYLWANRRTAGEYLERELPQVRLIPAEATYLLWLDISAVCGDSRVLADYLRRKTGLFVSNGAQYGQTGESFLRVNIACPTARLLDGLERLKEGVLAFRAENR